MESYVEFPKLGWLIPINDTLVEFSLFGVDLTIKWYGVLIAVGFLLAMIYALRRAPQFSIDPDRLIDVVLVCTVVGFIGARLYYVLFSGNRENYFENPLSILYVWEGGLGIYGGLIFAFLGGLLMCKLRKVDLLRMFDLASLGFLIGQAVGRWGNFFNQEAYGGNTDLPWGMTGNEIKLGLHSSSDFDTSLPVHPTFLYESLWCLLGFVLLHIVSKKAYKFKGQLFSLYTMWYGAGRFFIELLRTDSLMLGNMKVSCFVAILAVIGGLMLYLVFRNRSLGLSKTLVAETVGVTMDSDASESADSDEPTESDQSDDDADVEESAESEPAAESDEPADVDEPATENGEE